MAPSDTHRSGWHARAVNNGMLTTLLGGELTCTTGYAIIEVAVLTRSAASDDDGCIRGWSPGSKRQSLDTCQILRHLFIEKSSRRYDGCLRRLAISDP